jgi:hypothetical protein
MIVMSDLLDFPVLYSVPAIRCRRIVRATEQPLDDMQLNANTAIELGKENIGILAGRCPNTPGLIDRFRKLSHVEMPGTIVVVISTGALADEYAKELVPLDGSGSRDLPWRLGSVIFATPEKLRSIGAGHLAGKPVLAVVLVDPQGIVHQARGGAGPYRFNDRPQHIARFRQTHEVGFWSPPFFLLTQQPAKSLSTQQMLAPYSLQSWWFVDGSALRMGVPPVVQDSGIMKRDSGHNVTENDHTDRMQSVALNQSSMLDDPQDTECRVRKSPSTAVTESSEYLRQ